MKLLKIGSSSSSNIVLNSEFVSSHHAEILLLDSGEIILEDKNSTNGTFVGGKKITPNKEVTIQRGDYVKFADVELQWSRVPALENTSKYKSILNIGTNFRNDLVISGAFVSRFHATFKVAKDGKCYLTDLGSKNGTKVNGVKIQPGKEIRVKKGDIVLCGDVDVTEQLPFPTPYPWIKWVAAVGVAAAVLLGAVWILGRKTVDPTKFRPAVVWVMANYYYTVTFDDVLLGSRPYTVLCSTGGKHARVVGSDNIPKGYNKFSYTATAFFIDREGRMGTNRHVAYPWDKAYMNPETEDMLRQAIEEFLEELIPTKEVRTDSDLTLLASSPVGNVLIEKALGESPRQRVKSLNALINRVRQTKYTISGASDYISVGYPGQNYTHYDDFERCYVVKASETDEKDIAILQLNKKKTPSDIEYIFDVKQFNTEKLKPLEEKLYTIGYPAGAYRAVEKTNHSLEPDIRETMCSKVPGRYDFEFQGEAVGGASGSPIFNKHGELVGVLWGGWKMGSTLGLACQARYLKEMYEEEVGL